MQEKIPRVGSGPWQCWPHRSLERRLRPRAVPVSARGGQEGPFESPGSTFTPAVPGG